MGKNTVPTMLPLRRECEFPALSRLELIGAKLRGLGHLIETQRLHDAPIDLNEVQWGIGAILSGLSDEIKAIWRELDYLEIEETKARARRKGNAK